MGKEPVIIVEDLQAAYGDHLILDKVSFQVYPGEIFVIVGGSGCGKSTLLRYLIGLLRAKSGKVFINGVDLATADDETMKQLRKEMGVLFQSSALLGSMTLAENVALPLEEHTAFSREVVDQIVRMKLGLVYLSGYEDYLPSELSGGMKKRAGIARAMALDPTILFFDELSAGLDPVTSAELDLMVRSINEGMGTTMVVVTHELESIFCLAHRVIMLDEDAKGIIAEGDPKVLKETSTDHRVSDFFNRRSPASSTEADH